MTEEEDGRPLVFVGYRVRFEPFRFTPEKRRWWSFVWWRKQIRSEMMLNFNTYRPWWSWRCWLRFYLRARARRYAARQRKQPLVIPIQPPEVRAYFDHTSRHGCGCLRRETCRNLQHLQNGGHQYRGTVHCPEAQVLWQKIPDDKKPVVIA